MAELGITMSLLAISGSRVARYTLPTATPLPLLALSLVFARNATCLTLPYLSIIPLLYLCSTSALPLLYLCSTSSPPPPNLYPHPRPFVTHTSSTIRPLGFDFALIVP
jgi:hypothetical protein